MKELIFKQYIQESCCSKRNTSVSMTVLALVLRNKLVKITEEVLLDHH